jgi:hypothetical protein
LEHDKNVSADNEDSAVPTGDSLLMARTIVIPLADAEGEEDEEGAEQVGATCA